MADIGNLVPITVISRLIGFRGEDLGQLLEAAFDSIALLGAMLTLPELEELVARSGAIGSWLAEQLSTAMTQPRDDILGAIARGIEAHALSPDEGGIVLHTLLSAGGESTTSLLGNAVRLLGDVDIPAGSTVLLWGAANRDPSVFERPDDVVLNRPAPRRHVAFGRGIHYCVGAPLARMETRIALSVLLERTNSFALDPAEGPSGSRASWSDVTSASPSTSLPREASSVTARHLASAGRLLRSKASVRPPPDPQRPW
jgi:cytochrome P450